MASERVLASVRRITDVVPIEGADAIECAVVGGWKVVVQKGECKKEDLAIFCEIDAFIPHVLAPFLSKGKPPHEFNGVLGERLRTIKLRGQLSQGLLLPLHVLAEPQEEGADVTAVLNIQKYETYEEVGGAHQRRHGSSSSTFPSYIQKTDQERIQNLTGPKHLGKWKDDHDFQWEVSEKLDGSSMTVYCKDGRVGVCSRNHDLPYDPENQFWRTAISQGLITNVSEEPLVWVIVGGQKYTNFALQGELIGSKIQKNIYKRPECQFYLFDIYDIGEGAYWLPHRRQTFVVDYRVQHVPILLFNWVLNETVDNLLFDAQGKSQLNGATEREGLVYKSTTRPGLSFKAISNTFLLKHQD